MYTKLCKNIFYYRDVIEITIYVICSLQLTFVLKNFVSLKMISMIETCRSYNKTN